VNRADRTEDPATGVRWFAYDKQDNPTQVTDANGNATYFKYDVHGREIERSNALGNSWTFAYDSRDNMVRTVDANGQTINKTYDELSRMTGIELIEADGLTTEDTVSFGYDAMGQKTSAADNDSALAWSYDNANRVAEAETVVAPGTVQPAVVLTHDYDAVGNRTDLSHGPDGVIVDGAWSYLHDGNGNLTRVTTASGDTIDMAYDPAGRLTHIVAANTVETQVLYDALTGRPGSIAHTLGAATLVRFDYGFDTDGTITSIADAGGTRTFTYDATLQLTGGGYPTATEPRSESYAYDLEGNRTSSHLSASYTHDTANRLRADADSCYDYDENGNLARKRDRVGLDCTDTSGAAKEYTWDVLNRLVRIDFPDATYAAYRYDAQGRRIEKDVNGALTRYVYDGDAILLEYDGANVLQARYSHGEEIDQPLAMARDIDADGQLGAAESFFYHTDHLGSVRLVTDAAGAAANRYDYDAFGNWEATSYETVANPFGFTARERDAESGLMFYRARYYDPKIGRFISEDPIGFEARDLNLYRYAANSPLILIDPSGEVTFASYIKFVGVTFTGYVGYFAGLVWAANIVLSNPDIRYGSCKATFLRDAIASTAALFSAGMAAAIAGGAGASVGVALVGLVAGAISAVNIYVSECLSGTAGSA
jgi:RHS repeat-associated protein